jgi:hypothetical protein
MALRLNPDEVGWIIDRRTDGSLCGCLFLLAN